ncbi:putative amine oxidase [copper-containing] isoform X1 [Mytilus californianus]|uniref:putative amine oxidase [copper-containing] isoform X1 n=1 Tax=Mytilus californianus TaxID=6549 RepID=UPI002247C014|nr:putative amine oxidase [copper-containing] isoform X1 [Mytilus californianus]
MIKLIFLVLWIPSILCVKPKWNNAYGEKCDQIFYKWMLKSAKKNIPVCSRKSSLYGNVDLRENIKPSVFRDLTKKEIEGLLDYLYNRSNLNLTIADKAAINTNYIFISEVFLPPKRDVLKHLNKGCVQPTREARVMIFRGAFSIPDVIEIVVSPLPNPTGYRHVPYRPKSIPFIDRPIDVFDLSITPLLEKIDKVAGKMLYELYGGRLINCSDRCLSFNVNSQLTTPLSGVRKRLWFSWLQQFTEHFLLRPLDFAVLREVDNNGNDALIKIWFDGSLFNSLEQTVAYYYTYKAYIIKVPFPTSDKKGDRTVNSRGKPSFKNPLKDPSQVSPDGIRYNIDDRHVSYTYWEFDVGMSVFYGPRLNDIRYKGDRIAYEISLQELATFYSGDKPQEHVLNFLDTTWKIGALAKYLHPGIDCPNDATFISSSFKVDTQDKPLINERAFCIFEFNTGMPLRRHNGYFKYLHRFYEGVTNVALIVRTIPTIGIYDYVIDFIFFQNGVIEVKITPTGIVTSSWHEHDNPYSFQVDNNLMSPLHQHLFNLKMDLDIKGTSNRFETIDIEPDVVDNVCHKNRGAKIVQNRFIKRLKQTELQAAYKFNFDYPKLLTFVNNNKKDKFGNSPGYKLLNKGMTKVIRPPNDGNNPAVSWSQYQVAVTKYKDSEPYSSSVYTHSDNPVFTFQEFIDDNEKIVDEDLVAWVTMGMHHVVQKEDIPVTHTPGQSHSTFLIPFNYFDESPGMSAGNAVRLDPVDLNDKTKMVKIDRLGTKSDVDCIPKKTYYDATLKKNPCLAIECL